MSREAVQRVPLLDLRAQYASLRDDVEEAIRRVVESQHFILGPEVDALEREMADYCGTAHAVGVSSGTDALLVALMALGVRPGDEVITSPFTFFATAGTVARLGARTVFVDIDPDTFNIDPARVEAALSPRTKAIIPVHLFGRLADMDTVMQVARGAGVAVVEDAAQAIGARDGAGRRAGAIGDIGAFSFFPSKNLGAFGDAGMVTTSDGSLDRLLRQLRVHGMEPKYFHSMVGGNFRLDALQAAVLRVKLRHLDAWHEARRRNAARYRELFAQADLEQVTLPGDVPGHIYNQFVIRVPDRDALRDHLTADAIGTEVYYPLPLHMQECFADLGYRAGDFAHAERAAHEVLALPIYPELEDVALQRVVASIEDFYATR
ncbi:MAG TPA: DegT/DnrJ/EryC1/StrS family aminotransferase [Longimicrobiales bacterium]|nr:DegT/DnrJ/EryC1/StrS family aminotransferase [Longimicrobiales bacterium]